MSINKLNATVSLIDDLIEAEEYETLDLLEIYVEHRNCAEGYRICDDFDAQYESDAIAELALERIKGRLE